MVTKDIWKIVSDGLEIYSSAKLKDLNYPSSGHQFYLVCEIAEVNEDFAKDIKWDIRKLSKYKPGRASSIPFAVTLAELMEVTV